MNARQLGIFAIDGLAIGAATLLAVPFFVVMLARARCEILEFERNTAWVRERALHNGVVV